MEREPILITGASSLVGSRCAELLSNQYAFHGIGRENTPKYPGSEKLAKYTQCDILNHNELEVVVAKSQAQTIVHMASFVDIDAAERQKKLDKDSEVWKINVEATKTLAQLCSKHKRHLIYTSTIYVFDGKNGPYKEEVNPLASNDPQLISFYAMTKLEGEKVIKENCDKWSFIRFAWPFRAHFPPKLDFARWILDAYQKGKLPPMFSDQTITPIFIDDFAEALKILIKSRKTGVFHIGSSDITSPYQFAVDLIGHYCGEGGKVQKASYAKTLHPKGKGPRPLKSGVVMLNILPLGFRPSTTKQSIEHLYKQQNQLGLIRIN